MSRVVAIPMAHADGGDARRRAFMMFPLALITAGMIVGIASEMAGASSCSGKPLTVAEATLPELPEPA